jgi:hypothetical protein
MLAGHNATQQSAAESHQGVASELTVLTCGGIECQAEVIDGISTGLHQWNLRTSNNHITRSIWLKQSQSSRGVCQSIGAMEYHHTSVVDQESVYLGRQ